jgi:CRISPR-associated protein Csd2
MATQAVIRFRHDSPLGNAPAHELFERVKVERANADGPPRSFADYRIKIRDEDLPNGVTVLRGRP